MVKSGRSEAAETTWRQPIALKTDNAKLYKWLGISLFRCQRLAEAEEAFCKAIQLAPQLPDLHTVLSGLLFELYPRGPKGSASGDRHRIRTGTVRSASCQHSATAGRSASPTSGLQCLVAASTWKHSGLGPQGCGPRRNGRSSGYDGLVDFNRFLRQRYVKVPINFNTALACRVGTHPAQGCSNRGTTRFGCQTDELQMERPDHPIQTGHRKCSYRVYTYITCR